jgi:hypothetical protein
MWPTGGRRRQRAFARAASKGLTSREYRGDTQAENEPLSSGGSRQLAVPSKELERDKVVVG